MVFWTAVSIACTSSLVLAPASGSGLNTASTKALAAARYFLRMISTSWSLPTGNTDKSSVVIPVGDGAPHHVLLSFAVCHLRPLLCNVLFDEVQWSAACSGSKVTGRPKLFFPKLFFDVGKFLF